MGSLHSRKGGEGLSNLVVLLLLYTSRDEFERSKRSVKAIKARSSPFGSLIAQE
jgi:hypothetical protein